MRFDIVPVNGSYSGIDRALMPDDFLTPETKPYYDSLLASYFDYLDLMCNPFDILSYDEKLFHMVQKLYRDFCAHNVACELIAFDVAPIDYVHGVPVELLGIDIVHDMAESLICCNYQIEDSVSRCLNGVGLFTNPEDASNAIDLLSANDVIWKLCWVYKIII